jgi:hypothetical protein
MCQLAIFGETNEIEVVVVVGENSFRLVAETQEKVNVPGRAQHGAGIEFMGIGRDPFDFPDQRFSHSLALLGGAY